MAAVVKWWRPSQLEKFWCARQSYACLCDPERARFTVDVDLPTPGELIAFAESLPDEFALFKTNPDEYQYFYERDCKEARLIAEAGQV